MPRYFLEISYDGTRFSGFQIQQNANSVQAEVEKAYEMIQRRKVVMTGSSRTDTGVHARQNYFHFDDVTLHPQLVYKMNSVLPKQIAVRNVWLMDDNAHSRFDAVSRTYRYYLHRVKDPFNFNHSYFYPYALDEQLLQQAASAVEGFHNFTSFSKSNSQVKSFECKVYRSEWAREGERMTFEICGNRFLRGMVRLLVGAMLLVGRRKLLLEDFVELLKNYRRVGYSVPASGLFLEKVSFPSDFFVVREGERGQEG